MSGDRHTAAMAAGAALARHWRKARGLGDGPIDDLASHLLRGGLALAMQALPRSTPLRLEVGRRGTTLLLARHLSREGSRYWAAHGLGHHLFGDSAPRCCPPQRFDEIEARALGFADELLLPAAVARLTVDLRRLARWYGVSAGLAWRSARDAVGTRSPSRRIEVLVDHREEPSGVPDLLCAQPDLDVRMVTLPVADYLLAGRVAVERKTGADLVSSLADGRLFAQLARLARVGERPVLLLEDCQPEVHRRLTGPQRRGLLVAAILQFGVSLLPSEGPADTALLLAAFGRQHARRVSDGQQTRRIPRRPKPHAEERMLRSVPGIGPARARSLLERFGSLAAVLQAAPSALTAVPGIDGRIAKQLGRLAT